MELSKMSRQAQILVSFTPEVSPLPYDLLESLLKGAYNHVDIRFQFIVVPLAVSSGIIFFLQYLD